MPHYTLSRKAVRAALLFAAKQDIRYYLNGVLVELHAGKTRYVSTNGHSLVIIDHAIENEGISAPEALIIHRDVLCEVTRGRAHEANESVLLTLESDARPMIQTPAGMLQFQPIGANFPDYAALLETKKTGEYDGDNSLCINGEYVQSAQKSLRLVCGNLQYPHMVRTNDGHAVAIKHDSGPFSFHAVIMLVSQSVTK